MDMNKGISKGYARKEQDYAEFLADIRTRIHSAQTRAALSVNSELVLLYWHIGKDIIKRQDEQGWGAKVIDRLSHDLSVEFPQMKGFSSRNLKYMRAFAAAYSDEVFVQQLAAQIPWFHNCVIMDKLKDPVEREWYVRQTIQQGWSRNVLVHQIESGLFNRQGNAINNLERTLPSPQSELVSEILKDPYNFDFLTLGKEYSERDLHQSLITHIRDFLLELGVGFAFVGSEHHLEVGDQDFYIDLLFYHLKLRCYVVIELKIGNFMPEYAGKLNFYLSAVDDVLRQESYDQPSVGILLCKTQNKIIAEYALRDMNKPMGVSTYQLMHALPENLKSSLPSIEELEAELSGIHLEESGDE
jgi:predicted nuclease of restriction endonuclease-like (RecB) superfamily